MSAGSIPATRSNPLCSDLVLIDPKLFHLEIERLVSEKGCGYREALMLYQTRENIEIETVASLVKQNQQLKANLEAECIEERLVKPTVKRLLF